MTLRRGGPVGSARSVQVRRRDQTVQTAPPRDTNALERREAHLQGNHVLAQPIGLGQQRLALPRQPIAVGRDTTQLRREVGGALVHLPTVGPRTSFTSTPHRKTQSAETTEAGVSSPLATCSAKWQATW